MKKVLVLSVLSATLLLTGCISSIPSGVIYSGATMPHHAVDKNVSYTKKGVAYSHSVLGLVAWGDGGIKTATKKGNIKKLKFVDYNIYNVVGCYMLYRTEAYGD
jgi:hypothetical protein